MLKISISLLLIAPIALMWVICRRFKTKKQKEEKYKVTNSVQRFNKECEKYQLQDFYADEIFPEFYKEQIYLSWFLSFQKRRECFEKAVKKYESDPKLLMILEEAYAFFLDTEDPIKQPYESLKKATALWKQVAAICELEETVKKFHRDVII